MSAASILDRIEPWSTTGIGSLPFADPELAANHACVGYDLPFCPQLPRLDGDMISEWLGADPHRCGWSPERDRERPRIWGSFLEQIGRHPPRNDLVKLQVTGPVTLALALELEGGDPPTRARALELAREIAIWLAANVAGQVAVLTERGISVLLLVDEPAIALFGSDGTEDVWDPIRAVTPAWGFHFCCAVPWELVELTEPGLLSFDLDLEPIGDTSASTINRLIARGGKIAWGALSAHRGEHATEAVARVDAALEQVPAAREHSLLTASCGSGRLAPAREFEVASTLNAAGRRLRSNRTARSAA